MEKPEPSFTRQLGFALTLLCGAFMAGTGLLGFAGWWSDPSNQKWWALLCGLIGVAFTILVWTSQDELLTAEADSLSDADQEIKCQPVASQRNYWRKERQNTLVGALVIFFVMVGVWLIWEASHSYNTLFIYVALTTAWATAKRLLQISRALGELARD